MADLVTDEIARINNVLDSVPMKPGAEVQKFFLDIYKLTYHDIKEINLTEAKWDQLHPVSVNKLLKLGISFGNSVKSFLIEQAAYEAKQAQEKNMRKNSRQGLDPFLENYKASKFPVPLHYVNFVRNFFLLLKNFDIGTQPPVDTKRTRNSRQNSTGLDSDTLSTNGSHTSSNNVMGSPIKLNSRQLLIEKLEININLDPLFTMRVVLKLLVSMFTIVRALVDSIAADEISELSAVKAYSESSSIFSNSSTTSGNTDSIASMDDYLRLVGDVVARVNLGIVDPLNSLILAELVEPRVVASFQNLTNSI